MLPIGARTFFRGGGGGDLFTGGIREVREVPPEILREPFGPNLDGKKKIVAGGQVHP